MRNGINQAAMYIAKNAFDRVLWDKQEGDGKILQSWQSMISGFLAGVAGLVCTGPFDVVKTRLKAQSRYRGEVKYKGMVHAIVTIYKEERLRALWKGLLPRLMRIPPGQVADQVTGFYERRDIYTIRHPRYRCVIKRKLEEKLVKGEKIIFNMIHETKTESLDIMNAQRLWWDTEL
ncbi:hypothetical protein RHMOL_Rhmol04G0143800 [Rhododendron molle]|uniref:Uncharacterized protein n=1 Tax=Rhododendron molle TaxID=49168 RepID=A0ACC0P1L9_RHOML|nr:hypothetical protein RHMOL_Rhmol04G0143800 [Rhododendron molle]